MYQSPAMSVVQPILYHEVKSRLPYNGLPPSGLQPWLPTMRHSPSLVCHAVLGSSPVLFTTGLLNALPPIWPSFVLLWPQQAGVGSTSKNQDIYQASHQFVYNGSAGFSGTIKT